MRVSKLQEISEPDIAAASELVLQEVFGVIALESADKMDEKVLMWLYGLLCLLEKPLLPDQAGDLNLLLNVLLGERERVKEQPAKLAQIDVNIAIITEYFDQRFK